MLLIQLYPRQILPEYQMSGNSICLHYEVKSESGLYNPRDVAKQAYLH